MLARDVLFPPLGGLPELSNRQDRRYYIRGTAQWGAIETQGREQGFVENISTSGCLLRTTESIPKGSRIRLFMRLPGSKLWFALKGEIIHLQNQMEPWDNTNVTLFRLGIRFIAPMNDLLMTQVKIVGIPAKDRLPDELAQRSCRDLLLQDQLG